MGLPTVPMPGRRGAWNTCCRGGGKTPMGTGDTDRIRSHRQRQVTEGRWFRVKKAGMGKVDVHKGAARTEKEETQEICNSWVRRWQRKWLWTAKDRARNVGISWEGSVGRAKEDMIVILENECQRQEGGKKAKQWEGKCWAASCVFKIQGKGKRYVAEIR